MKSLVRGSLFSIFKQSLTYQANLFPCIIAIRRFELGKHRENVANMRPKIHLPSQPISLETDCIAVNGNKVQLKIYKPLSLVQNTYPTALFVHGTGFISPEYVFSDMNARYLSSFANCQVINLHHNVAPEYPFPIPLNEVLMTYNYLSTNYQRYNINRQKFVTLGYSSGATFLAELGVRVKKNRKLAIKTTILVAPFLDFSGTVEKDMQVKGLMESSEKDTTIPKEFISFIKSLYVQGNDVFQPILSPYLHCEDELSSTAKTEIVVGSNDRVFPHAIGFTAKLMNSGVPVHLHIAKNEDHSAFWVKLYYIHYVAEVLRKAFVSEKNKQCSYKKDAQIMFFSENNAKELDNAETSSSDNVLKSLMCHRC